MKDPKSKNKQIAVTLYENHYEYGVGALLNSLVASGFDGIFCVGYKGELPFWKKQIDHQKQNDGTYKINENFFVRFDLLEDVGMHFGYYKPYYLKEMANQSPQAGGWFYFDPDIVVIAPWSFYENWISNGVALCQDSNHQFVHYNHPWRNQWRKDFSKETKDYDTTLNYYINSGFIGVNVHNFEVIDNWIAVNEIYRKLDYPIDFFNQSDSNSAYKGDQDVLNATITVYPELRLSIIGPEAMGFNFPVSIMAHAVDGQGIKPWKRDYIKNAISGRKASVTDEAYLNFCRSPIQLYSASKLKKKRRHLKFSKLINRVWKK